MEMSIPRGDPAGRGNWAREKDLLSLSQCALAARTKGDKIYKILLLMITLSLLPFFSIFSDDSRWIRLLFCRCVFSGDSGALALDSS